MRILTRSTRFVTIGALAAALGLSPFSSASAETGPDRLEAAAANVFCVQDHLQAAGWEGPFCPSNGQTVTLGTTGQNRRMEALRLGMTVNNVGICLEAHVQNIGWQGWVCRGSGLYAEVGTTGQSLRMEALSLQVPVGTMCANAYVQNIGWQGVRCGSNNAIVTVGTTGQSLTIEALQLTYTL
ncbi:hypothetical protein ACFFQW_17040 [Umezawaea endophytica]|uniref:Hydrophobic W protein n=1 Tax=Umezawaea endophytica TaxID=1654476 RepID=A0A9X2VRY9_9PSEU|nr:hypothetical protein [Umezawaea endophytica]MCS7480458.1 hypothetical protein [Umezawaea endophytica]